MKIKATEAQDEGVRKADGRYVFDYEEDQAGDIISLTAKALHREEVDGIGFYYFGYEFSPDVGREARTAFIHDLKFPPEDQAFRQQVDDFVSKALSYLSKAVVLQSYDFFVYPTSKSGLTSTLMMRAYARAKPANHLGSVELVKAIPSEIGFDYDGLRHELEGNGVPQKDIDASIASVEAKMERIQKLDYFSIARDSGLKPKYRRFIENYYRFPDSKVEASFRGLASAKILVFDDVLTSGATMANLLKTIKSVNPSAELTVFTLLGKHFEY